MSFIVVKYGKDQEKLFNTNCKVINLLHCIRETCGCKDAEMYVLALQRKFQKYTIIYIMSKFLSLVYYRDLAEEGTGVLQLLPANLHEHTNSVLVTPKAVYVLIRIQSIPLNSR
jgi:hypothetical protein